MATDAFAPVAIEESLVFSPVLRRIVRRFETTLLPERHIAACFSLGHPVEEHTDPELARAGWQQCRSLPERVLHR